MNARSLSALAACAVAGLAIAIWFTAASQHDQRSRMPADTTFGSKVVVAPFEATSTTLRDCDTVGTDKRQACVDQAFGNLAFSTGAAPALAVLERRANADTLGPVNCHRVAHSVGAAAIARADGDVARALAAGTAACASGYYHGVVERALAGVDVDELAGATAHLCDGTNGEIEGQCLHGLGHGLMLRTVYDLPAALDACDGLGDAGRDQCASGAFMENHSTSYGTRSPWLRDSDLTWPCGSPDIANWSRTVCWTSVAARAATALDYDLARVDAVCADAPQRSWRRLCIRNLGELAAEQADYDVARTLEACRVTDGPLVGICLQGAATITVARFHDTERASALCEAAGEQLQQTCSVGVRTQGVSPHTRGTA